MIERQDAAAFERLAAADFRFIDEDDRVLNHAQYITARSHSSENVTTQEVYNTAGGKTIVFLPYIEQ